MELLEKKEIEDEQDQTKNQEELVQNLEIKESEDSNEENSNQHENQQTNLDIPPPPEGFYEDLKLLTNTIQDSAQANVYSTVIKRTLTEKSITFKCDRYAIYFLFFKLLPYTLLYLSLTIFFSFVSLSHFLLDFR